MFSRNKKPVSSWRKVLLSRVLAWTQRFLYLCQKMFAGRKQSISSKDMLLKSRYSGSDGERKDTGFGLEDLGSVLLGLFLHCGRDCLPSSTCPAMSIPSLPHTHAQLTRSSPKWAEVNMLGINMELGHKMYPCCASFQLTTVLMPRGMLGGGGWRHRHVTAWVPEWRCGAETSPQHKLYTVHESDPVCL